MRDLSHLETAITETYPQPIIDGCERIAPAWPLDASIAVNPWWPLRSLPFSKVSAKLGTLGQVNALMPAKEYQRFWRNPIQPAHLSAAAKELGVTASIEQLTAFLDQEQASLPHWHHLSELLDDLPERQRKMRWHDEIIQQISQFCALYFQHDTHIPAGDNTDAPLYSSWLKITRQDKGIEVLTGEHGLHRQFRALPECPKLLCAQALHAFGDPANQDDYAHALLLDINGWASWMAYQNWQDNFGGQQRDWVLQLLAIRLAWELALWRHTETCRPDSYRMLRSRFINQFRELPDMFAQHAQRQQRLWVWQRALELSYQQGLQHTLLTQPRLCEEQQPELQAAFCIDVRSEPMRRALEAQHQGIRTIGFAGFFGLPLEYQPGSGAYRRPQLPGLLAPQILARQTNQDSGPKNTKGRGTHLDQSAFDTPSASFGLVEMLGLFKSFSMLKNSLRPLAQQHPVNQICDDRPFVLIRQGQELSKEQLSELAATVLTHMGLTSHFAPVVLLLGHGCETTNNPQAASLDCGACGGQTGEVNVKVLAQILNNVDVRRELTARGIVIPDKTRFVAGLHNTTTDDIICYDKSDRSQQPWRQWLKQASELARQQRESEFPDAQFHRRSRNWSEIRPEWGLADNAAFIVAPRSLTRGIDLQGRCFLHDYEWQQDRSFRTLELIMTAPMIVTNWINLQYYASTVDNRLYGSGNKLLHNVVGEHIGVFEGNGGDLRTGLAIQSLHDGSQWRHEPLRLSVYIVAPREAILDVVRRHTAVAELIDNDWLTVFQWDAEQKTIGRLYHSEWIEQENQL